MLCPYSPGGISPDSFSFHFLKEHEMRKVISGVMVLLIPAKES
jgi:hypothetical protein